jgi:hypothetical protein
VILLDPWLVLDTSQCGEADAARFAPLFQEAWTSLPGLVREVIRQHWTADSRRPTINLEPFHRNSAGNVRAGGRDVRFNCDLFRIMPERHGRVAIVHELGHTLFLATGEDIHQKAEQRPGTFEYVWSCELINLELVRRWGHPQDEFSDWLNLAVSTSGPYLRDTAGEPPGDPSEYRQGVARLMARWGREQGITQPDLVEQAHRRLLSTKEPYYQMAVVGGSDYETQLARGMEHLRRMLRDEAASRNALA